jgi:hypothetical protein
MPLVSVVIPTFNSARYVTEAVESVLSQTFTDLEVLVVDDGSTDDTRERVAGYPPTVRYLHQANAGVSMARNHGIAQSRGRYVAFLDADDTWKPEKLERQLDALSLTPEMGVCYTAFFRVDSQLRPIGIVRSLRHNCALADLLMGGNVVGSICSVLVERSLLDCTDGFDPMLSQCADWDMWVRLARYTEFLYLDEPLVTYRQHGSMMSHNVSLLESDSLRVLEKGYGHPDTPADLSRHAPRAFGRNWMVLAGCYFHAHRYADAARCAMRSLRLDPLQGYRLLNFPLRRLERYRRSGRWSVDAA